MFTSRGRVLAEAALTGEGFGEELEDLGPETGFPSGNASPSLVSRMCLHSAAQIAAQRRNKELSRDLEDGHSW